MLIYLDNKIYSSQARTQESSRGGGGSKTQMFAFLPGLFFDPPPPLRPLFLKSTHVLCHAH